MAPSVQPDATGGASNYWHRGNGIGEMGSKLFTPEQELEIVARYEQVETARVVAEEFGTSSETIRRILKRHGVPRTHRHPKQPKTSSSKNRHKGISTDEVCELYEPGVSLTAVAAAIGCTIQTIRYHMEKGGIYDAEEARATKRRSDAEICRLYDEGKTNREIAELFDISPQTVSKVAKRNGLKMRGKGQGAFMDEDRVCPCCGETFIPRAANQVYCSQKCINYVAWQKRSDAKRISGDGTVETISLKAVYRRDHGRCYICGCKTDWNDRRLVNGTWAVGPKYPTRDHVVALHNGGLHTWDNIRLACKSCNSKKRDLGQIRLAI